MSLRSVVATVLVVAAVAACGDDSPGDTGSVDVTESRPVTTLTTAVIPTTTMTVTLPTAATTTTSSTATSSPPVSNVLSPANADLWRVINDTVMGGVSSGELAWSDGALVFTGALSLEHGGGFVSIRSPDVDPQIALGWAQRPGVRVQVDGNGRTWTLEVRTEDGAGGWIRSFPTSPDGTTEVELPWTSFEPVTRFLEPRSTDEPLDPSRIVSIAFYLVDRVEGPYRLVVRSIT